jgi:probable HAF family extracellular repeat protein
MRRVCLVVTLWVTVISAPATNLIAVTTPQYTVTDLGSLGGGFTEVRALNAAGQVTGLSTAVPNGPWHAFFYSDGMMTDLGTLGGSTSYGLSINQTGQVSGVSIYVPGRDEGPFHVFLYSEGIMTDVGNLPALIGTLESFTFTGGLNDSGHVTGLGSFDGHTDHAFLYSGGLVKDLGTLGGDSSAGLAINAAGQVTGVASPPLPESSHGFLYSNGVMHDLGTLGGITSSPTGLNDAGQVIGDSPTTPRDFPIHAFLYSEGVMRDLGTLGGPNSHASAINAAGQITGDADIPDGSRHVFLFSDGGMGDLGTLGGSSSSGRAINAAGWVTGSAQTGDGSYHAFLYRDGVMYDLNSLIHEGSDWTLTEGLVINDRGQIAGSADIDGEPRAVLLSPVVRVPEVKDDCKGGGWRDLVRADGTAFKNQGDCVSYVNTGK